MEFNEMNGPQLVAAWNEMVLTANDLGMQVQPVKKFSARAAAIKRCQKLHAEIQAKKPLEAANKTGEHDDIPDFLKRTETPEQAEKRRAKLAKRDRRAADSSGLTVIEPPPASIRAAILKDLQEPKHTSVLAEFSARMPKRKTKTAEPLLEKQPKTEEELTVKKAAKKANGSGHNWLKNEAKITKTTKPYKPAQGSFAATLWGKIKSGATTVGTAKEVDPARAPNYLRWFVAQGYATIK